MKRLLIVAAVLASLSPPAGSADKKAEGLSGDLARFQGEWVGKFGPGAGVPLNVTFKGHSVSVRVSTPGGEDVDVRGEFRLDETARPHKTIDWVKFSVEGGDALPDRRGIYVFEDADTLKTCSSGGENDRPGGFDGGEPGATVLILKREKADEPPRKPDAPAPAK